MHALFGTVLWLVVGVGVAIAIACLLTSRQAWSEYGRRGLLMERDDPAPEAGGASAARERDEEVRQMLEARNARRARRGEAPLDVEAELRRLTMPAPAIDAGLREEIREMVLARNHRRARRGQPPLDVEAEVAREIAELGLG